MRSFSADWLRLKLRAEEENNFHSQDSEKVFLSLSSLFENESGQCQGNNVTRL
jgi:hypothetical protein